MSEYEVVCPFKGKCKLANSLSCETCGHNSGGGNYYIPRFPDPNPIITPTIFPVTWKWWTPNGTAIPIDDCKPWIVCCEISTTYSYKEPDN